MATSFWEIVSVEAVKAGDVFAFTAVLDGPGGMLRVPLPVEALLDYAALQRHLLLQAGIMYRHVMCEGREPAAANEAWKAFTTAMLNTAAQMAQAAALAQSPAN